jgi:hypothetical protein
MCHEENKSCSTLAWKVSVAWFPRVITVYLKVGRPRGLARNSLPVPIKVFLEANA